MKDIIKIINIFLPAQNAAHNTMLNPTLGQNGVNAFEFSKRFNEISKKYKPNIVLNVKVLLFSDKTFDIKIESCPSSYLINEEMFKLLNLKVLNEDNLIFGKTINLSSLYIIVFMLKKGSFLNDKSYRSHFRSLLGTVKSMHCNIVNDLK